MHSVFLFKSFPLMLLDNSSFWLMFKHTSSFFYLWNKFLSPSLTLKKFFAFPMEE